MKRLLFLICAVLGVSFLSSCADVAESSPSLVLALPGARAAVTAGDIDKYEVSLTGAETKFSDKKTAAPGERIEFESLDEDTYDIAVSGFIGSTKVAYGEAKATVKSGATSEVAVAMKAILEKFTVTFETNGGSEIASQSVEKGGTASEPAEPTKSGNVFLGWFTDADFSTEFYFTKEIVADTILYAKWILIPEGFVFVPGITINGDETWTPASEVFVSERKLTIYNLFVCEHEVTQAEYTKYCKFGGNTLNKGVGDNYPAYFVNWYDAIVYCNLRSMAEGLTPAYSISGETDPSKWTDIVSETTDGEIKYCGPNSKIQNETWDSMTFDNTADGYRLPTEAEWEYIAREAGTSTTNYSGSNTISDVAWYKSNASSRTHVVKSKTANSLGIYDMCGNVLELCWDWYEETISSSTATNGPDASSSLKRVRCGGSWNLVDTTCTVNCRASVNTYGYGDTYGFRVVRTVN